VFWGDGSPQFELQSQNGTPRFFYYDGDRHGVQDSDATIPTKEWVHLFGVYDNDAGTTTVYMNGEEVASTDVSVEPSFSGTDSRFASHPNQPRPFDGRIDEVLFYDRALSDSEITDLANRSE